MDQSAYIAEFIKFATPYYEMNDSGHQIDHAIDVMNNAFKFKEELKLDIDDREIIAATMMHDIQLFVNGRKDHHIFAKRFACSEDYPGKAEFSFYAQARIAAAVFQHRASYTGTYTSKLSELVSSADRGIPSSYEDLLARITRCKIDLVSSKNEHRSPAEIDAMALEHLKDKFGSNGYARYPDLYMEMFKDVLEKRAKEIDAL